jgi:hypothetical protein
MDGTFDNAQRNRAIFITLFHIDPADIEWQKKYEVRYHNETDYCC